MHPRWGTNNLLLNHPEAGAAASTLMDSLDEIPLSRTWHDAIEATGQNGKDSRRLRFSWSTSI
jgi:hypothetical protein